MALKTTGELLREVLDRHSRDFAYLVDDIGKKMSWSQAGVSPLEYIVGLDLLSHVCIINFAHSMAPGLEKAEFFDGGKFDYAELKKEKIGLRFAVWHQVKVGKYKADFIVRLAPYEKVVWYAVECDGHNYHNLTKEQAVHDRARDRHFQQEGLVILRFAGTEIWRDPAIAGEAVLDHYYRDRK